MLAEYCEDASIVIMLDASRGSGANSRFRQDARVILAGCQGDFQAGCQGDFQAGCQYEYREDTWLAGYYSGWVGNMVLSDQVWD